MNNLILCEGICANKTRCTRQAKYSTLIGRVLCGTHVRTEKAEVDKEILTIKRTKQVKIVEVIEIKEDGDEIRCVVVNNTFEILELPTELVSIIVGFCNLKSKLLYSLSNLTTKNMFPEWSSYSMEQIELYVASNETKPDTLIKEAKSFKIKTGSNSKFSKLVVGNNTNEEVVLHFINMSRTPRALVLEICKNSNSELFKKLAVEDPFESYKFINAATESGNLEYMNFIIDKGNMDGWEQSRATLVAARKGNLEALKLLLNRGGEWTEVLATIATTNGFLDILTFAHENNLSIPKNCLLEVIKTPHIECLKYLFKIIPIPPKGLCNIAAKEGKLEYLRYFYRKECKLTPSTCTLAAEYGNLECLKYLHRKGCKWNKKTYIMALKNNHTLCVEYLFENGCPRF